MTAAYGKKGDWQIVVTIRNIDSLLFNLNGIILQSEGDGGKKKGPNKLWAMLFVLAQKLMRTFFRVAFLSHVLPLFGK